MERYLHYFFAEQQAFFSLFPQDLVGAAVVSVFSTPSAEEALSEQHFFSPSLQFFLHFFLSFSSSISIVGEKTAFTEVDAKDKFIAKNPNTLIKSNFFMILF